MWAKEFNSSHHDRVQTLPDNIKKEKKECFLIFPLHYVVSYIGHKQMKEI